MFRQLLQDLFSVGSISRRSSSSPGSCSTRRRRSRRRNLRAGSEFLEPRWLLVTPTTEISLVSGNLTVEDIDYDDVPVTTAIIDNDRPGLDDPGFVGFGPWVYWNYNGYNNNHLQSDNFTVTAEYTFTGLRPGERFQVSATWTTFYNRTSAANYTIHGTGQPVVGVVDQRIEPSDFFAGGVGWKRIGIGEVGSNGTLRVWLSNPIQYRDLIADAVRIDVIPQGTKDDTLSLGVDSSDPANPMLVLSDPAHILRTSIAGATGSLTNTVRVPMSLVGNEIRFDLGLGNDVVTLDLVSSGLLNKSYELRMRGGDDGLVLMGPGSTTSVTAQAGSLPGEGTLTLNAPGRTDTIRYIGLEAIDVLNLQTVSVRLPGTDDTLFLTGGTTFFRGVGQPALRVTGQTRVAGTVVPLVPIALRDHQTLDLDTSTTDGQDVITLTEATGAHGIANLRVATGTGADRIEIATGNGLAFAGNVQLQTAGPILARGALSAGGSLLATAGSSLELANLAADSATLQGSRIELQGTSYQISSGDLLFQAPTTLNAPAAIQMQSAAPAGRVIRFQSTLDGSTALEITAGISDLVFQQAVGNTTPLSSLTIHSAAAVDFLQSVRTSGSLQQLGGSGTTTLRGGSIGRDLLISTNAIAVTTGTLAANVSQAGLVQLVAQQAITLQASLQANAGRIDLRANQDGAGSESLTIGPNITLTTSNGTADAIRIAANTAAGGTGSIRLRPLTTGNSGRVTILAEGGELIDAATPGDGSIPGQILITAAEADLRARSVGSASSPLRTSVNRLVGQLGNGTGLFLFNNKDLTIGSLSPVPVGITGLNATSGSIEIVTSGALTIDEPLATGSGGLLLNPDGDDLLLSLRASVSATQDSRLLADRMHIDAPLSVPNATLELHPESTRDAGDAIVLGSLVDTAADTLELSAAELDRLQARLVRIGNQTTSTIQIRDAIDLRTQPTTVERLVLTGTAVNTTAGGIRVNHLAVISGGVANLGTSDLDQVAVQATGPVSLFDTNEVTIGTVEGVTGLRGTTITLAATSRLTIDNTTAATDFDASGPLTILLNGAEGRFEVASGAIAAIGTGGVSGGASIMADEVELNGSLQLPGQDLLLQPYRAGQAIVLGANPGTADTLELSDNELDRINQRAAGGLVGRLTIGNPTVGNIHFLGPISPAGADLLWLRTGAYVADFNSADPDLTIGALYLDAQTGIGSVLQGSSEAIELAVSRLDINNAQSGGVRIENHGPLRLVDLDGTPRAWLSGGGVIRASSPLSIETPQSPSEDFAFIAADDPLNAGDQLTISADVSHSGSGSVLTFQAGDDLVHTSGTISSVNEILFLADHEARGDDGERGRILQTGGRIAAPRLLLSAYELVDVTQPQNDVDRLAGKLTIAGSFSFRDEDDLELGPIGNAPVIQTNGVQAPGGQVSLTFATTRAGNLTSAFVDQVADLIAQQTSLLIGAAGGQIGSTSTLPLELNTDELTAERAPGVSTTNLYLLDTDQGISELLLDAGTGLIELQLLRGDLLSADTTVDLIGHSATISVAQGNVGSSNRTAGNAIQTTVSTLTVDTAASQGHQFLLETDDLEELDLRAGQGDIQLAAGRILSSDLSRDLQARRADLLSNSMSGGVGTGTQPGAALQTEVDELLIDTSLFSQPQFIREADGLLELQLLAGAGSIRLTTVAAGDILSADTFASTSRFDLSASQAQIVLAGGRFGSTSTLPGQAIETRVDHLQIDTTASGGDQFIREAATLQSLDLQAGMGEVTLWADGAILDRDTTVDIQARSLIATADQGIGQRTGIGRALDTQLDRVFLTNLTSGDIQLDNRAHSPGSLELAGLTQGSSSAVVTISNRAAPGTGDQLRITGDLLAMATGTTVTLISQGPLTVAADVQIMSHGALLLQAVDSIAAGDALSVGARAVLTSLAGLSQLLAGDHLLLARDSSVVAQGDVTLRADVNNADPLAGTQLNLEGSVTSQQGRVWIETGAGNDVLTFVGSLQGNFVSGSPLPGDALPGNVAPGIVVQTFAGDDQLLFDSNGLTTAGGTVDHILADLLIRTGIGQDTIQLEDSSDSTGDVIDIHHLLAHTVSGLISNGSRLTYDGELETLDIRTSDTSADQISLAPSLRTAITLRAGGPTTEVGGDSLLYQASATKQLTGQHTGQLSTPGYQPVNYAQIERLSAAVGQAFDDTIALASLPQGQDSLPNHLRVQLDATRTWLEIGFAGQDGPLTILSTQAASSMISLQITGSSDDDLVSLNFVPGYFPLAVTYAGAGQATARGDQLAILGNGTSTRAVYRPDANRRHAGRVRIDAGGTANTTVDFIELEPLDITAMVQTTFELPSHGGQLTFTNGTDFTQGQGQPAIHITGTTGSGTTIETVAVWNSESLLVTSAAGIGDETVLIQSADNLHRNSQVTIDLGEGNDLVQLDGALRATGAITIRSGGSIRDGVDDASADLLTDGPLRLTATRDIAGPPNPLAGNGRLEIASLTTAQLQLDVESTQLGRIDIASDQSLLLHSATARDGSLTFLANGTITAHDVASFTDRPSNQITLTARGAGADILVRSLQAGPSATANLAADDDILDSDWNDAQQVVVGRLVAYATNNRTESLDGIRLRLVAKELVAEIDSYLPAQLTIQNQGELELVRVVSNAGPVEVTTTGRMIVTLVQLTNPLRPSTVNLDAEELEIDTIQTLGLSQVILLTSTGGMDDVDGDSLITTDRLSFTSARGVGATQPIRLRVAEVVSGITTGPGDIRLVQPNDPLLLTSLLTAAGSMTVQTSAMLTAHEVRSLTDDVDHDVRLTSEAEGIRVLHVSAGTLGDLTLSALGGSILGQPSASEHVRAALLTLTAAGSVALQTSVSRLIGTTTTVGSVSLQERDSLMVESLTTANGPISIVASDTLTAVSVRTSTTNHPDNQITLRTTSGSLLVDLVETGRLADILLFSAAAILESGSDAAADLIARRARLDAQTGIGVSIFLETDLQEVDLRNQLAGSVLVDNLAPLRLVDLDPTPDGRAIDAPLSTAQVWARGSLTILSNAITAGETSYVAWDDHDDGLGAGGVSLADDLGIDDGVLIQATSGPLTLRAGDQLAVGRQASLVAGQMLSLFVDVPFAAAGQIVDPDSLGATVAIYGNLSSGTADLRMTTGDQDDLVTIDNNAGSIGDGGTLNGLLAPLQIQTNLGNDRLRLDDSGESQASNLVITNEGAGAGMVTGLAPQPFRFAGIRFFDAHLGTAGSPPSAETLDIAPNLFTTFDLAGRDPSFAQTGVDTLRVDLQGVSQAAVSMHGPAAGLWTFAAGLQPITFSGFEKLSANGGLFAITVDMQAAGFANGLADQIDVQLTPDGRELEVIVNGTPLLVATDRHVASLSLLGSIDAEVLRMIETAGGIPGDSADGLNGFTQDVSGSHTNEAFVSHTRGPSPIAFLFAASGGDDRLVVSTRTSRSAAYFSDRNAASNSGLIQWATGSRGWNLAFSQLEAAEFRAAGGDLLVDATANDDVSQLTISNAGGLSSTDGFNSIQADASSFSELIWGGFSDVVVRSGDGPDHLTLASLDGADPDGAGSDGLNPAAALSRLTLSGDNTTATDSSIDTFDLLRLPSTITLTLLGDDTANPNPAADRITVGNQTADVGLVFDGLLDALAGPIVLSGDALSLDQLTVDDSGDTTGDRDVHAGLLTSTTLRGLNLGAVLSYDKVARLRLLLGNDADQLFVQSTAAQAVYRIELRGGNDSLTVGSQAPDLSTSLLNQIQGSLQIDSGTGTDSLVLSDQADTRGETYRFRLVGNETEVEFTDGSLDGALTPEVRFLSAGVGQLEQFTLLAGSGNDRFTTLSQDGGSRLQANLLASSSNHLLSGAGADLFELAWAAGYQLPATQELVIDGGSPSAVATQRDRVRLYLDAPYDGSRQIGMQYAALDRGDVELSGLRNNSVIPFLGFESLEYYGDAALDDEVTVTGPASGNATFSVTPLSAHSANLFLGGSPRLSASEPPSANQPGVAGGSSATDLYLHGLRVQQDDNLTPGGLQLLGGSNSRLIVNTSTEDIQGAALSSAWNAAARGGFGSAIRTAGQAFDQIEMTDTRVRIRRLDSQNQLLEELLDVRFDPLAFQRDDVNDAEVIVQSGAESTVRNTTRMADDITVQLSSMIRFQVLGGHPPLAGATSFDGDHLLVRTPGPVQVASALTGTQLAISGPFLQPLIYDEIERLTVLPENGILQVYGDNNGQMSREDRFIVLGEDVDQHLSLASTGSTLRGDADGANEVRILLNQQQPLAATGIQLVQLFGLEGDDTLITEPFATLSQGWGVNVVFEGGLGNDRLRYGYIDPLPELDRPADGSLRGVSENVVLTGSATRGSGQLQVTQGDASFTILQLDFSSLEDVALDLNDASMGDDDRLTIAGTSQADEITADFSRAGTFADPWIIYGPSAAPRFTISQFVRWSATSSPVASLLPQLAFAMQAGDDGLQITSRTNANHPLAPTLLAIDGGSSLGGDQIVVTGTSSANDTFRYVPGPLGAGQLEVTRFLSPTTTLQFSNTERVAIDGGGGLGSDRLTLIGTAQPDLITLGATTVSGGTLQLGNTTQLAFDRFGYGSITNATEPTSRIVVQSLGGSDTIQLQHRANWQIAEVSIEAGDQTPDLAAGDTVSLTTSDEADDILFDALSMNSGTFVVRAGGTTTRFSLLNVESVLLDAADPSTSPGDVLSSNVLLTPGTDPGSGSSTVATLLPLQYRHVEVATPITGSVLEVEGTDGDDIVTITIEDYDQDRLVDDPVLRINGVPFDLRGYSDVILDTKGGNDRVTLIPTVGDQTIVLRDGLTIRGGTQGTIGDTFELQGVGSGLTALSVQQMERISILGRDDVDRLTSTRDRIRFEQGGIHTEFSIDPLSLQKLTAILLGGDDLADFSQLTRPVELWGGNGNDLLRGGSGADQLYGEQGNDQLQAGPGNDQQYGGEGSDLFIWNAGDGADLIEGHAGIDQLLMVGNPGSDRFELSAQGARLAVTRSAPGDTTATLSLAEVEELELNTLLTGVQTAAQLGGEDQFIIQDLSTTDLRALRIGLGAHDDEVDTISIHGRSSADNLLLMADDLGLQVAGLQHTLRILAAVRDEDRLQVFGHGGDDRIVIQDLSDYFAPAHVKTYGGDGQDTLSGFGYFYGDAGDDQLTGDAYDQLLDGGSGADRLDGAGGSDRLFGQSGDDLLVASTGNDRFDGGTGFDTILQLGTIGADSIVAYQASATQLQLTLNDVVQSHTLVAGSLEQLQLQAGSGTDQLRVRWHDLLSSEVGFVLPVLVIGEAEPSSADRLTVVDDGSADAAILRTSRTVGEGLLTLGPANPQPFTLTYRQLQQLTLVDNNGVPIDPNATSGSRLAVFAPDDFEPNNNAELATSLGLLSETIERQGTIDPAGDTTTGQAADVDWFRFQAPFTGLADITLRFQEVGPREGRPGLPGNGNLDLMLYNASGMVLAGNGPAFGTNDGPAELNTDGDPDAEDERIRMPIVKDSIYLVRVAGRTAQAINSYRIHFSASAAPTPQQLQLRTTPETIPTSDTGRSNRDQITQQVRPTLLVQVDDYLLRNDRPDQDSIGPPLDERIPIPFPNTHAPGYRVAIFQHGLTSAGSGDGSSGGVDSGSSNVPVGFASRTDSEGWYAFTLPTNLTDGTYQFSARVQMIEPLIPSGGMTSPGTINPVSGFGPASERLTMVVDTVIPELSLGSPSVSTDGLQPESGDTGISGDPQTFSDRVTSDSTPWLWGYTEPQAIVRVYVDRNRDGSVDANDLLIGSTTAASNHVDPIIPPLGTLVAWNLIPNIALDDPRYFPASGVRPLLVVAEDVAGNNSSPQRLNIFLDKSGPVITGININQPSDPYSLFDPRAVTDSFTPPVRALVIHVLDRDPRDASDPGFLYAALHPATTLSPARYSLVGLQNGVIPIQTIEWNPSPGKAGEPASGTITLRFANPLPDDRYTLTLDDQLRDPAGNQLDGESNAAQPLMAPAFPSGDGTPGGSFLARFNIDSRVELAAARNGQVAIDANGNFLFDPGHADASYRDVVFSLPQATDQVFAGNWAPPSATAASGFDKLGVYGLVDAVYRFALDTDDNGSLDFTSVNAAPFQIAGKPIAGDFATQHPGDEIGLFDPQALRWILDTDGNQRLQSGDRVLLLDRASYPEFAERRDLDKTLFPLVGDFNGDGVTDLTLFDPTQDRFHIDLNRDGRRDAVVDFGIPGQTERPITGDFNLDGVDDLGVVTYDPTGNSTAEPAAAFWSILVSDVGTQTLPAPPGRLFAAYSPTPVGNDLFASFGSVRHQPLAGNFATVSSGDPPGSDSGGEPSGSPYTHPLRPLDVNNDGWVTAQDALRLINAINRFGSGPLPLIVADSSQDLPPNAYLDVTQDGSLTPLDVLTVVNALNRRSAAEGSASGSPSYGEGEAEGEGDVQSDHPLLSNRMVLQARDRDPLIRIQNSERGPSDIATPTAILTIPSRSFAPSLAQDVAHDCIPSTHGHHDPVHDASLRPLVSQFAKVPSPQQSHALSASTPSTCIAFQPERRYLSSRTFDPLEALSSGDLNHRLPGHSRKHSFSRPDPTQLGSKLVSKSEPVPGGGAKHAQRDHSESVPTLDPMIVDLLLCSPKDLT